MTKPVIITVAITGAIPRKKDCPGLPVIPSEQIEETHAEIAKQLLGPKQVSERVRTEIVRPACGQVILGNFNKHHLTVS